MTYMSTSPYAGNPWRVAILVGADPAQPAAEEQIRALRATLVTVAPDGVEFYTDWLDDRRVDSATSMPSFLAVLKAKYEVKRVDIVIGLADFALDLMKHYHQDIWPGAPVIISSVENHRRVDIPAEFAYVPMRNDIAGTMALAEALQPHARKMVIIAGVTKYDLRLAQSAADTAAASKSRKWTVEIWSGFNVRELQQRLAALDLDTAVIYTTSYRDREGLTYFPFELVAPMVEALGAPIYGWYPAYLSAGLTAGSVISFEANGRLTGELAASILLGKTVAHGATTSMGLSRCVANVGQFTRFGLRTADLPANCELMNVTRLGGASTVRQS
jgi:ABC-type uncharacterized transport system substrate-binding protein